MRACNLESVELARDLISLVHFIALCCSKKKKLVAGQNVEGRIIEGLL